METLRMKARSYRFTLIAFAVAGALAGGYLIGVNAQSSDPAPASVSVAAASATPVPANPALPPNFASIVKQNGPAVVNISVNGRVKVAARDWPGQTPGDPFSEFFRQFQAPTPQEGAPTHGLGSGFIVRPDGVIVTNAHVIDGADEVTVKLTDKREFKAKVIGVDKPTDIAVLKIDASGLPTVRLGDPAQTGVGDWVLAIGSPFGFENSVTAGIVSAKSRSLPGEGYSPFIQTDAAVNPGNSGGPLFNAQGEVIGVNSQIYTRTGGYQGLSFALPIDVALKVEKQLLERGKVSRGRLGVSVQDLNQALAESFGLDRPKGALVDATVANGPAAKAGVRSGDVILKLNGRDIQDSSELPPLVADLAPGSETSLTLWREGKSVETQIKVEELNEPEQTAENAPELAKGRLGLAVRPLTPEESRQVGAKQGLLVEQVSGPAERAGILPGDVVLAVNGKSLANPGQLREWVSRADKHVALLIQRGEAKLYTPVDLS
jgi:serine protease Do